MENAKDGGGKGLALGRGISIERRGGRRDGLGGVVR